MTLVYARRGGTETGNTDAVLDAEKNLQTGENKFKTEFSGITSLERDLLLIAAAVYATDRTIRRAEREDAPRDLHISVPVVNIGVLQPEIHHIEQILRKLSSDSWTVDLRQIDGVVEKPFVSKPTSGKTLLFSGGLDSLSAAIEFGLQGEQLQLVSHLTHNQPTAAAQEQLVALMSSKLGFSYPHRRFMLTAYSKPPSPQLAFDLESSQRTRSFLFLTLAALCARRAGHAKIVMIAENGQMAIHLPITEGRIGPYSTRTAHPDILRMMEGLFTSVLSMALTIENPYVNRTKAEVVSNVVKHLPEAIPISSSCWKNARLKGGATHCGFCIPCILRRISIEVHRPDVTVYARDLFSENLSSLSGGDDGRRNLVDYALFVQMVLNTPVHDVMMVWPELISPSINTSDTMAMYRRAAVEAQVIFGKYPGLRQLLS
jgi:7-cyano-7-deazaguanine synthase in queuosine biosynthesis